MSLLARYEEALELTKAQTLAIRAEEWEKLEELLASRQQCLNRAAEIIPVALEKEAAIALLGKIRNQDETNQKELIAKKAKVQKELTGMNHFDQAMGGYGDSSDAQGIPKFFDGTF